MAYKLKLDKKDYANLKEFGLPISNFLILTFSGGEIKVEEWPGAGGSYFSNRENEFPGIKGLDEIEITLPNGRKKRAVVPFSYGPFPKLEEED
jgi:hypothetical protein